MQRSVNIVRVTNLEGSIKRMLFKSRGENYSPRCKEIVQLAELANRLMDVRLTVEVATVVIPDSMLHKEMWESMDYNTAYEDKEQLIVTDK